jgi:hypothetical protein
MSIKIGIARHHAWNAAQSLTQWGTTITFQQKDVKTAVSTQRETLRSDHISMSRTQNDSTARQPVQR